MTAKEIKENHESTFFFLSQSTLHQSPAYRPGPLRGSNSIRSSDSVAGGFYRWVGTPKQCEWFSTYREGISPKLAAIVADLSEEQPSTPLSGTLDSVDQDRTQPNSRELEVLWLVVQGLSNSQEHTAAVVF
jgi:hypothetical protein